MPTFFLFIIIGLGFSACNPPETKGKIGSETPPNLVLIIVDDLGYADVGFNGCQDIPTPNIDRIASSGVKFTNGYVSWAACGPSRAGLITGRYQDRFGFARNPLFTPNDSTMGLPLSEQTLPEALQQANYKSVALGKWHLGAHPSQRPLRRGFDDFFGFLTGGHQYFPENWTLEDEYDLEKHYDAYKTKLLRNDQRVEETEYLTDALSREATQYINKYKDGPFFIYLAYNAPHLPLQATDKYLKRFEHIEDETRKTYAAMVSAVDDGVGQVLDQLESLALLENTIVVFISDNGGPEHRNASDNGPLRGGKGDVYEGGIRVPFAMSWPKKIEPGTTYDAPVISLDIFATIIAQSGDKIKTKHQLDGVNILPYLSGEKEGVPHEMLFWRKYDQHELATRAGNKKLVLTNDSLQLYDLQRDIGEESDQVTLDVSATKLLEEKYNAWVAEMIEPAFLGLSQDNEYNQLHPGRFERPTD